jgi:endonuclease YncB( thermonuclease family)
MSLAAAALFLCTPIAVYDGDGPVRCREGEKIRIAGIAAREMDDTCRPGHPCPSASAIDARDALVNLFGGARGRWKTGHIVVRYQTMTCRNLGRSYDRVVASCTLRDGRDLGRAMLATGTVAAWQPRGR